MPILDDLRTATNLDQRSKQQIAEAAGIHRTTFSAFMTGRRGLSIETAEQLAAVLGRPLQLAPAATAATPKAKRKA